MKAILLTETNEVTELNIENDYREMQKYIDGYFDAVALQGKAVMLVDDEGLLKGKEPNMFASIISEQYIVGKALVVGVDDEDFCDIPDRWLKHLKKLKKNLKECPKCGQLYIDPPALSRIDNTPICPDCGIVEALADIGLNVDAIHIIR